MDETPRRNHPAKGYPVPRFLAAGVNPTSRSALDEQAEQHAESAAALVAALDSLRHHLMVATPSYVVSDTYVFGGPTTAQNGGYAFDSPFDSPSQYRVVQVAFTGAGTALISQQRGPVAPANTATIDPSTKLDGQLFAAPGALTVCGSDGWTDIPGNAQVFLAVATAVSTGAFATVQFRRRVSPAGVYSEGHS